MNYYRRYVGDYQRKTMRLNPTDHGVYDLMLDYYYAEEQPLPLELDDIYAICKAIAPDHRRSVAKVLGLYFTREADGYHNKRADEEIAVAKQARVNGKGHTGGGKATGTRTGKATGTVTGPVTGETTGPPTGSTTGDIGGDATGEVSGSVHPPTTNHQPPTTSLQPPTSNPQPGAKASAPRSARAARKTALPPDFSVSERVTAWARERGFPNVDKHFDSFVGKARAKGYTYVDWDEALMSAIRDDWAGLRNGRAGQHQTLEQRNQAAAEEWLAGGGRTERLIN